MSFTISVAAAAAFMAGIIQGVSGFGSGTVQMMILPLLFPLNEAAGIGGLVASRIADRIDGEKLKRIVYWCVGIAGIVNLAGI